MDSSDLILVREGRCSILLHTTVISTTEKPPVFGPCKMMDFELEMVSASNY